MTALCQYGACRWQRDQLTPRQQALRDERIAVVNLIKRLCHNNPHPFAEFDWQFRLLVVRSCVRAIRQHIRPRKSGDASVELSDV
jgi:hypothetical protein